MESGEIEPLALSMFYNITTAPLKHRVLKQQGVWRVYHRVSVFSTWYTNQNNGYESPLAAWQAYQGERDG